MSRDRYDRDDEAGDYGSGRRRGEGGSGGWRGDEGTGYGYGGGWRGGRDYDDYGSRASGYGRDYGRDYRRDYGRAGYEESRERDDYGRGGYTEGRDYARARYGERGRRIEGRSRVRCRDIMTKDVVVATRDTTLQQVAAMMRDEDTGVFPVVDRT